MSPYAHVTGWGMAVPERVLTNHDLAQMVDTNDDWIRERTGILERHIAGPAETSATLAAQAALKLLKIESAAELAQVIVCVGLAQNLAALRALATEGIQRGHMSLHARQVAVAAGAIGEEVERLANQLVTEKLIRTDRAEQILKEWRK